MSSNDIAALLKSSRTIAVVGLSSSPMRPSHGVAEYMREAGYEIIPVNPMEGGWYGRLEDIPGPVDIVNVFRRSEFVPEIVESAIRIGAKAVWLQEGVVHEGAAEKARSAGLQVVMDRCILKEHLRLKR